MIDNKKAHYTHIIPVSGFSIDSRWRMDVCVSGLGFLLAGHVSFWLFALIALMGH